jgi:ring-1,2-phenylacetyl-CoA epoxidase subunit PaaD
MTKTEKYSTIPSKEETEQQIWEILGTVYDPEIPVLSILDLGIVREIKVDDENIEVAITPTYSGCPAMDVISINIRMALIKEGFTSIKISQQLSPAWTTDWMTQSGKDKLKSYGIAPPVAKTFDHDYLENLVVECPLCHSQNTRLVSQFGSTACKALYQCLDCKEPFDYFKCH